MKTLNIGSIKKATQKGFTIIELVVVILLLGILTATALPRFMDVTDEAHGAVVDAVEGSFRTGVALFHAQWLAQGQPDPTTAMTYDGGTLYANAGGDGYPSSLDGTYSDSADCEAVFDGLLSLGGLDSNNVDVGANATATETAIEGLGTIATDEWVATELTNAPLDCVYTYTGQYKSGGSGAGEDRTLQILTYDISAGTVTPGTVVWNN